MNKQKRLEILKKILSNYKEEKQAILLRDPHYFTNILKERANLIEILRSLENETTEKHLNLNENEIKNLIDAINSFPYFDENRP